MTLSEYLEKLRGKRVTVLGVGISNRPLIGLLLDAGADVTARTKAPGTGSAPKPTDWRPRAAA